MKYFLLFFILFTTPLARTDLEEIPPYFDEEIERNSIIITQKIDDEDDVKKLLSHRNLSMAKVLDFSYSTNLEPYLFRIAQKIPSVVFLYCRESNLSNFNFDHLKQNLQLKSLDISRNKIATLQGSKGALPLLKLLDLSKNNLSSLPKAVGISCPKLKTIRATRNKIRTIEEESIGEKVKIIDFSHNQLRSISSSEAEMLKKIKLLFLGNNKLTSLLTLKTLTKLTTLDLRYNKFFNLKGFDLENHPKLTVLNLSNNFISEVSNLSIAAHHPKLKIIKVHGNNILDFSPLQKFIDQEEKMVYSTHKKLEKKYKTIYRKKKMSLF